jgi:guanylate kinase
MKNDAPKEILEEVKNEYEKTLVIPENKPSPQWMLMPVGIVGSGKTTVVKSLAEHFGLIRISTDEIRKRLKTRGFSYEGCRDIANELDEKYLNLGYSLAIDANTGSKIELKHNKETKDAYPHVRQVFIHINPPDEYVINKFHNHQPTWLFKDSKHAIDSFLKQKKEFVLPDLSFVYTFDPSRDDFPEQLKEGISAIQRVFV